MGGVEQQGARGGALTPAHLLEERVDDGRAGRDERRLQHVAQEREDGVEARRGVGRLGGAAERDALAELGEDDEVELPPEVAREDASDSQFDGFTGAAPRAGAMRVGTRVRHPLFGIGVVESVTPRGGSTALRVAFKAVGSKTLIQEFARLQVIG